MEGVEFGGVRGGTSPSNVTNLHTHVHIRVPHIPFMLLYSSHLSRLSAHMSPNLSLRSTQPNNLVYILLRKIHLPLNWQHLILLVLNL